MVNESGLKSKTLFKDMISNKEWHINKTKNGNYAIMEPEHKPYTLLGVHILSKMTFSRIMMLSIVHWISM